MTPEIGLTLAILLVAIVLFISERLRIDLVALLVLGSLVLTGLVTPGEAISGFSNPAVITVWAVFIISGGLHRTGVSNFVGRQVMRFSGGGEVRLLVVTMLAAGVMSAFMNNIGVAAMLLPVVVDIARRTRRPPSKLLIPLAYGTMLGGVTTLIGTPSNILASGALSNHGLQPFQFFDFTPIGSLFLLAGIAFMAVLGRHLLPTRDIRRGFRDPGKVFSLEERLFILQLPKETALAGVKLAESHIGSALSLNVVGIMRGGETQLAPGPEARLEGEDRLLVIGRPDKLAEFNNKKPSLVTDRPPLLESITIEDLVSTEVGLAEVSLVSGCEVIGQTLEQADFRSQHGVNVLAIWREGNPIRSQLQDLALETKDILLIQGSREEIDSLRKAADFQVSKAGTTEVYHLDERLLMVKIPEGSGLAGKTLGESHLGDAFGLSVLGIIRNGETKLMPKPKEKLRVGDKLLVEGKEEDVRILQGLQGLRIEEEEPPDVQELESEHVALVEAVLSPHSDLAGKTLRQVHFREKYGLSVLAIWRGGRAHRFDLRNIALRLGDGLLIYGPREKLKLLAEEEDFLMLSEEIQAAPLLKKAPIALLVLAGVVLTVGFGWLPIEIASILGATLMVLTRCLSMEEAHRAIDWRAVFLIAGMLPLGIAMEKSGAARFLAENGVNLISSLGPLAILGGIFLLTNLSTQMMPNAVAIVLMAPIALNVATELGLSPYPLLMTTALAASSSFLSPVSHAANVLVMGPGGYRFKDYIRVGLPLTLIALAVTLLTVPYFWPLSP